MRHNEQSRHGDEVLVTMADRSQVKRYVVETTHACVVVCIDEGWKAIDRGEAASMLGFRWNEVQRAPSGYA